jgi:hypothetical protein
MQMVENQRLVNVPAAAAFPAPQLRRRRSVMPVFDFPVRGSVVVLRPSSEQPVASPVTTEAPPVRRWLVLCSASVALAIAGIAIALLS